MQVEEPPAGAEDETSEAPPVDIWSGLTTIDAARAAEPLPIDPFAVRPSIICGTNRGALLRLSFTRSTKMKRGRVAPHRTVCGPHP